MRRNLERAKFYVNPFSLNPMPPTRRHVLGVLGSAGTVSIVGCLGGGNGSDGNFDEPPYDLHFTTTQSGSPDYANALSIQNVLQEHSDDYNITVEGNLRGGDHSLASCEKHGGYQGDVLPLTSAMGEHDFELECVPMNAWRSFSTCMVLLAVEENAPDIQSTDDLDGKTVWLLPSSTENETSRRALENTTDAEIITTPPSEMAGEVQRGNIDVIEGYPLWTGAELDENAIGAGPQWQEVTQDKTMYTFEWTEEYRCEQNLADWPTGFVAKRKTWGFDDISGEEVWSTKSTGHHGFTFTDAVPADIVHEIMTLLYENSEMFMDGTALHCDFGSPEEIGAQLYAPNHEEIDMHPGALQFYEEHGVDVDELSIVVPDYVTEKNFPECE